MPNSNYLRGVRKERAFVNEAREQGKIAFRSAGSHSPIDVCIIDPINKKIEFIQCKPGNFSERDKEKIFEKCPNLKFIDGLFEVSFGIM